MIVTLLLWATLGWLLGLLVFFTAGFVTLPLGEEWQNRAAGYYTTLASKLLDGAVLIERGTGYDLFSASHDSDKNADKVDVDGNTAHVSNETGLRSTLDKRAFGLIAPPEENEAVYVSPELSELGEIETQRIEQERLVDEDGIYQNEVTLPPKRPGVKLREFARRMIPGNRQLWDLDETEDLYKQSQSLFGESQTVQFMILIIAYSVGVGLAWLVLTNAGGAAPSSVDIPSLTLYPVVGL